LYNAKPVETKTPATEIESNSGATVPDDPWMCVSLLPCVLSAEVEVPHFTVGDLLDLEVGSVTNSHHSRGAPVPLWVNGVRLCWAEFDAIGKILGVRVTERNERPS
jgi:flagellar motor switch/type III secretory pathway protein FliN